MPGKKQIKTKVSFGDIVSLAKSGWTPDETNALLDRLESMGDPTEPLSDSVDDGDDNADDDTIVSDVDDDINDHLDDDTDSADDKDDESSDKASSGVQKNLDRVKALAYDDAIKENDRLKKEIARLRAKNRNKDLSDDSDKKTNSESLIDAFQSCF